MTEKEKATLRELGGRVAELASQPFNDERKRLWRALNGLHPERPMVVLDQLPWHELDRDGELTCVVSDPFWRERELDLRKILYRHKYFPADMVVENRVDLPKSVRGLHFGLHIKEETRDKGDGNDIVSHKYIDQIQTLEDVEQLQYDHVTLDAELDARHVAEGEEIFGGVIPVRLLGVEYRADVWDNIAQMKGAGNVLNDLAFNKELLIATAKKLVDINLDALDQCERLGILDAGVQTVHCTGTYVDELPHPGYNPEKTRAEDVWVMGMAQVFSTVSSKMHEKFDIDICKPLYERFGLMYYGCCEPLHKKIDIIRKIKNVRKISISPWAKADVAAENMGGDYVMSYKPNPGWMCSGDFFEDTITATLTEVLAACKRNNTPCEIVVKDVSTLNGHPEYLERMEKICMEMALNY